LSAAVGAIHLLFRSYFLASSGESALLKIQNTADMATFAHTERNQHPENDHQLKKKYILEFFLLAKRNQFKGGLSLNDTYKAKKIFIRKLGSTVPTGLLELKITDKSIVKKKIKNF
jgi:hypothetical protein